MADFGLGNFRIESKNFGKGSMRSFEILPAKTVDFLQDWKFFGLRITPAFPTFN